MAQTRAETHEIAIVGGGLVGSALAYGLARAGAEVLLLDAGDDSFHASAGNFGLVWVQGKGLGLAEYAALSRRSADLWSGLAAGLAEDSGIDCGYRRTGGTKLALSEEELARFETALKRMHNQAAPGDNDTRIVDRGELMDLAPAIGPAVVGGTYCPHDGFADPLATLAALRRALLRRPKVRIVTGKVTGLSGERGGGFTLSTASQRFRAGTVVLAAGLGNAALAPALGLAAPLRPQRGQILVTERLPRFLDLACHTVRQTGEGTVLLGDSHEDVGFDRGTSQAVARAVVDRAVKTFPCLADARLVRQWGALRVLSPDGFPIYQESERFPGAFLMTCHSGVTLAAVHALELADDLLAGRLAERYPAFSAARFDEAVA
ncbi:NAD(P)/FAD-dependent oxidoreductase [Pelagibius sp.]|uniref:NAD(P)/FAD-dependent oxidoreductase n=1 Tax=Pelagibius sp. TaxID=1931238 RepID=UPI003B50E7E4